MHGGKHADDDADGVINRLDSDAAAYEGRFVDELGGEHLDYRCGRSVPPEPAAPVLQRPFAGAASPRAAGPPTLFGIDVHTKFQAGLNIEQVAREGFSWITVKVSQGTGSSWAADADAWMRRAEAAGMLTFAYHYLTTADVDAQARTAKAAARGRPVMVDFEEGSGDVGNLRRFLAAAARVGMRVPLAYVPRWYWQKMGSAPLTGLPPLVSSRYRTATGPASTIYAGVPSSWWEGYGGAGVAVLQFSDRATVAGKQLDVNAFRGTREQLRALIYDGSSPAGADGPSAPRAPGGIETMAFTDQFVDWAGNKQTVQSWMDHVDQRLFQLGRALVDPSIPSPVDGQRRAAGSYLADIGDIERRMGELDQKLDRILAALPK